MPHTLHLEPRWIMDPFGDFLQYDSMSQCLISTPFTSQSLPNLFTFIPVPEKFPHRAILRLKNSIPAAIPAARFVAIEGNPHAVAIQNLETERFLCSLRYQKNVDWIAEGVRDWEHFFLLSKETMAGLSMLTDPEISEIKQDAATFPALQLIGEWDHGRLGEFDLKLSENFLEFSKLNNAALESPVELSLKQHRTDEEVKIQVTLKRKIQPESFAL